MPLGGASSPAGRPLPPVPPHHHQSPPQKEITGPQPADDLARRHWDYKTVHTIQLMLEEQERHVDSLRAQLAASGGAPAVKLRQQLESAESRRQQLLDKLASATGTGARHSGGSPTSPAGPAATGATGRPCRSPSEPPPPPLPARNRPLVAQVTAISVPPALPPRTYRQQQQQPVERSASSASAPPGQGSSGSGRGAGGTSGVTPNHQRTKSSPDPVSLLAAIAERTRQTPRRLSSAGSMGDLGSGSGAGSRGLLRPAQPSADGAESPLFTPPGTPPPPYGESVTELTDTPDSNANTTLEVSGMNLSGSSPGVMPRVNQPFIMSIEDDDLSDQENGQDDHGPFNSLNNLLRNHAHLAVFINYVISNCDPASLFFYLVSDLYKEGNAKDMRRWAYEIHSSFLVPGAAMRVSGIDESVVLRIDEILLNDLDKEDKLRTVFQHARARAREEVSDQLADFRSKRAAGLGAMFGPRDAELEEARHDKPRETRIVEEVLVKLLETVYQSSELENATEQIQTHAASLTTVLYKLFGCRSPVVQQIADNCPMFASKEKSFKSKLLNRNKKPPVVRGHQFVPHSYYILTMCNVCGDSIRGISPQGYQCAQCEMNIHKQCLRTVEEQCVGAIPRPGGGRVKMSRLMGKIRPTEQRRRLTAGGSSLNIGTPTQGPKRCWEEVGDATSPTSPDGVDIGAAGDRGTPTGGKAEPRRPDTVTEKEALQEDGQNISDIGTPISGLSQFGKFPGSKGSSNITRSESYRDYRDRQTPRRHPREKRKHSDPNIPSSKASDAELENDTLCNNNNIHSGSSSNSSLSARLDSPSTSLDLVVSGRVVGTLEKGSPGWDSDIEVDQDPGDWQQNVDPQLLRRLRPKEKQRLDVVNELFHTERTHVRNLKILVHVFYRPMLSMGILQTSDIHLLFGNLEELLEIHSRFSAAMKKRQREEPLVEKVGDLLTNMFQGESGENFKTAAAAFCRCQSIALEKLRWLQKRDSRLASFLSEAESDPACRRLQLKDILPTAMQRLTKYPLLLANLAKYTARGTEEYRQVQAAGDRSRAILEHVNKVKGETERHERLVEIQSKLEQNSFTRADSPIVAEFNGRLDLTKYRMIHEGPVLWKFSNKGKHVELHMVLLERFIVLLQKQDDKYVLKFHTVTGREMSPIIRNENILVRPMATEKRAFFILHNLSVGPQIYELLFGSSSERDTWYRLIKDAADAYQGRDSKGHKRAESAHTLLQAQDSNDSTGAVSSPVAGAAGLSCREEEGEGEREGEERPPPLPPPRNSAPDLTQQGSEEEPQAPPTSPTASRHQNLLSLPTTTGGGDGASGAGGASPGQRRRMQRVEMMKITECTPLIDPKEVVVSQGVVLSAEPVLTPIERLRRKDEQVRRCLAEKEELVADILQIPRQDFRHIAEMAAEPGTDKDARELILNAILSVDRSMSIINDTLRVGEADIVVSTSTPGPGPGPAARSPGPQLLAVDRLLRVNSRLAATLTSLLGLMTEREEERERMRRELRQSHRRLAQLQLRAAGSSSSCQQQESQPESQQEPRTESQPEPAAELSSAAEQTDTDEESSRTKPDVTSSQDSSTELANETLDTESTHETETFDSASSSSACLTFESAADHT